MIWGIITSTNVDYAELMWEEFVQDLQTFLTYKANLDSPTKKDRKDKPYVIPYCLFTKVIICHLGRIHNIHQRSSSPFHLAEKDLKLAEQGGKKKPVTAKKPKPSPAKEKSSKPTPVPKPKAPKEKPSKPSPTKPLRIKKVRKICKGKSEGDEFDVERSIQMSLESFHAYSQEHVGGVAIREPIAEATRPFLVVESKGKAIATDEQAAQSLPSAQPQDDSFANIVCKYLSPTDAKTGADTDKTNSERDTEILLIDEKQGKDTSTRAGIHRRRPGWTRPWNKPCGSCWTKTKLEPTHEEFMANVYLNVHGSLKFPVDEHVILEEPQSLSRTVSSIKNLDDAYTIKDQFINDKSTEDEPGKLNVKRKVISMVTVLIHQASSSVPPLSTTIIDLSPLKSVSSTTQPLIFTTTTMTTTTLPPPPQQQSIIESELATRVAAILLELPKADMKEILHQRMLETGTYKSLPKHVALYEAFEASMEPANMDEFLAVKDKSRKRRLKLPQVPPRQKSGLESEKPVKDVPMPETTHPSDTEDTDSTHLLKIKPRPKRLKLVPEEERPATPEPD
nr:hypothetical protein [Tanacetum cinerariifolium]